MEKYQIEGDCWELELNSDEDVLEKFQAQMKTVRTDSQSYATAFKTLIQLEEVADAHKVQDLTLKNIRIHPADSNGFFRLNYFVSI